MASITLTIPDAVAARVLNAFCYRNGYEDKVVLDGTATLVDNPVKKIDFMRQTLLKLIIEDVKEFEGRAAMEAARATAISLVEKDVKIS